MVQLVYASAAVLPFSAAELVRLLDRARPKNQMYKVTGMLLYHSGSFLQVLEGPEEGVARVFRSIEQDPRHTHTRVLARVTVGTREFDQWAMGFEDTSNIAAKVPGLIDYYRKLPQLTVDSTEAKRYLRFFQQGLCRQQAR